ncbi:MAG: XrtA/PEP-CTERM system histidine kinase PrsK [Pseudomonadota bacterium]
MINLGSLSYGGAMLAFAVLSLLLLTSWRGRLQGGLLVAAAVISLVWAGVIAALQLGIVALLPAAGVLEVLRALLWAIFLLKLLNPNGGWQALLTGRARWWTLSLSALTVLLLALVLVPFVANEPLVDALGVDTRILGQVIMAVAGLVLVEQLFRNTRPDSRWAIKYLCLGVGGLLTYDFFFYSDALLFKRLDLDLWQARGLINALVVPLIAVSAARNPEWSLDVFVSRRIVFHSAAVLGAGIYLLAMAGGGVYLRLYGGTWGNLAQAAFLFGAGLILIVLMFSGQMQARLRVFLNKHFFNYRYDYREEWLRFIRTLSAGEPGVPLRERAIEAVANIMDSPGGALWWRREPAYFEMIARWNMSEVDKANEPADSGLARFLMHREWVIDLSEHDSKPEIYADLRLPDWLRNLERAWLVVPLIHHEVLHGFIVLTQPRAPRTCNWEDNDLLKTAGRQAANHIAQLEAAEALANARQFEAFNRLSAFLIHDLKNVVAQLSLVVSNAAKHRHNPAFVDDAFKTVEHATGKMNRMLAQLRSGAVVGRRLARVDLTKLLSEVVGVRAVGQPVPVLKCSELVLAVTAERERLADVLGHVVQNAQEATPSTGKVEITLQRHGETAVIEVTDNGCGMDADFIRDRLFRPFDSTKGRAGMGIGAYETREFVREMGGQLDVESRPGIGTTFRIQLPLGDRDA